MTYQTPKEKLEALLAQIENDLDKDRQKACQNLSNVEKSYINQKLLDSFTDLWQRYIILKSYCSRNRQY
ncbi:hypothetical protein DP116_13015 [Brasilonema bromeliae SPC951]|uniref:Uncharacterized protein n=1 Tax=Brasilonema bromeliae SPC951 TaxID=385972 RepID=A0ABX1P9T7_9CYAN|nr:hypothetical protein [Brasilonema bromeliae SPC951]